MLKTLPDSTLTLPQPTIWHLGGSAAILLIMAACAAAPLPPSKELQAAQSAIAASRLSSSGKGEGAPVASNGNATGRQMNRRVEVVIANTVTAKN